MTGPVNGSKAGNHTEETTNFPSPDELFVVMKDVQRDLRDFVLTDAFQEVLRDLYEQDPAARPAFVRDVLLHEDRLRARGVVVPAGMQILRSSFGDRRPTLFCVKKPLPERFHVYWGNCNITFDNAIEPGDVPTDSASWRHPLPPDLQADLMERGFTNAEIQRFDAG